MDRLHCRGRRFDATDAVQDGGGAGEYRSRFKMKRN